MLSNNDKSNLTRANLTRGNETLNDNSVKKVPLNSNGPLNNNPNVSPVSRVNRVKSGGGPGGVGDREAPMD